VAVDTFPDGEAVDSRNNSKSTGYGRPPVEHQFKPGNPGRPKGSRNKFGEAFIQALADDFERHGAEVIERVRIEKPEAYLKVIASLLPRDLNLNVSKYDHLSDEQLIMRLRILTEQAAPIFGRLLDHNPAENDQTRSEHALVAGNLLGPLDD
jgi:hypothetical protein